jgi:2-oxoglutarate ferredoxin oxidoreductase subunit delta
MATTTAKARKFRGEIFIAEDRCKECGFCIEFCPPKVLEFSVKFNRHGYHPPILVNEDGCTGCDLCGLYCPDFAIYGIRVPTTTTTAGRPSEDQGAARDTQEELSTAQEADRN